MATTKVNYIKKIPATFCGFVLGIVGGAMAGTIFADMGFVSSLPWIEIFVFLGAMFGAMLGFNYDE